MYNHKLQSVIIEGGSKTLQNFITSNLWDQAQVYKGTSIFKKGIESPKINGEFILKKKIKNDTISIYKND